MWGINKNILIILIVFSTSMIFGQNRFEFDYARFYNPADSTGYLELYYSFYRPALKTVEVNNTKVKQGKLSVKIFDTITQEMVVDEDWQLDIPLNNQNDNNNKLMVGLLEFPLEFSNYRIDLDARDQNSEDFEETSSFELIFKPLVKDGLTVSDIELASGIVTQSQEKQSLFYKNSIEVIPNPSLIYGDTNPVIFFYAEVYGLKSSDNENYTIEQQLFNSNNKVVHKKVREVSGDNSSVVEIGAIKANELNSGIYTLVVSIKDAEKRKTASSAKRVYIYNKDLVTKETSFSESATQSLDSEFMIMSEDEINYMWETAKYIATEMEKTNWEKLKTLDAKRAFLSKFWQRRDNDKSDDINQVKKEYYERVRYANEHYGNLSRREGWKTDRGRILLQYGVPDEIEKFQNESYSKPYEIWSYRNIEGGVIFLFADEEGLNIYRLVHSTKRGEIYNYREYQKYVR